MTAHAARDHATWSASASERLWNCPGSLALTQGMSDKESHAAAWGTACHEVSEKVLRDGGACIDHLGTIVETKEHRIEADEEVAETAQVYVDYVQERAAGKKLLIEQRFDLSSLGTPFDAGGTGDAVILDGEGGMIEVVDLKGGRGVVVEATGNKQLRTYALGAVLANPGAWKTVRVTIVQPRAPHPDGRVRSEEFHVADLIDWSLDLLEAMQRAKDAEADPTAHLSAGDHCTFCKARATCPALASRALAEAHTFFDNEKDGALTVPPDPASLTTDQIVKVLDAADMIQNWLNAVRAHAQDQAESGVEVPGYVLVPKRATRKWVDDLDVFDLALATGREVSEFYQEPKLKSPAMVEKLLGKKGYEEVEDLVTQESSGLNLTRGDKTTRGAVVAPAKQFFQNEGGQDG